MKDTTAEELIHALNQYPKSYAVLGEREVTGLELEKTA
jgi:hypothetical protein